MKTNTYISLLFLTSLVASCSVNKYLPPGEKLFRGEVITIIKNPEIKESNRSLKNTINLATRPNANKYIFGFPYKVWMWYAIGEPKREKGIKSFLRKRLAEEPVFGNRINTAVCAENIESLMENLGYFHTKAKGDTFSDAHFIKAKYTVTVQPQYKINEISWIKDSSQLIQLLEKETAANGLLQKGSPYRLSDISSERDRLDDFLKTMGYYYFNPDYILAYADSTIGDRKVNLLLNLKSTTPYQAKQQYLINDIKVYPGFSISTAKNDTTNNEMIYFDGLIIKPYEGVFKNKLFATTIDFRKDSIYSSTLQNNTLNSLINLGTFKFVKNRFDLVTDSGKINYLNLSYFLTPAKRKSIQGSLDGFTKDNNFIGSKLGLDWKNRNSFHGAEQLDMKLYGGFETSLVDSLKGNDNYRIGGEMSMKFPSYVIPFIKIKENSYYPANTNITLGYEWYRKKLFYTKHFFRFQYEFVKKPSPKSRLNIAPVSLIYTNTFNITDSFSSQLLLNPSLITSIYPEAVLGSFFSYTLHSGNAVKNRWLFTGGVDLSGNVAGFLLGAKEYRSKNVLNVPFAQYVKFDLDMHYTRSVFKKMDWANRVQIGIGLPYNNSRVLPFSKLYTIGGANSIRGFNARSVGPGTVKTTAEDQNVYQLIGGDFKLLANTEWRFSLNKYVSWAVFADAGNTWTKDTILFGPLGKLSKQFMKEVAVAAGTGIRFDATVILIRFDFGIPLKIPYLPDGNRWVINQINFGDKAWRKQNLILNIAIGLPF